MSTIFSKDPATLNVRKDYAKLLQRAFDKVGPEPATHEFLYYPKFAFDTKVAPLILVDFDPKLPAAIKTAKNLAPTAKGFVKLTPAKELDFAMDKGSITASALASDLSQLSIRQEVFTGEGTAAEPVKAAEPVAVAVPTAKPLPATPQPSAPVARPAAVAAKPLPVPVPAPTAQAQPTKPLPQPPSTADARAREEDAKAKAKALLARVGDAPCAPGDAATKDKYVKAAIAEMQQRDFEKATAVLHAYLDKHGPAKPLPVPPSKPVVLSPAEKEIADDGLDDEDKDTAAFDDTVPRLDLDKEQVRKAALAPSSAVAAAQQALVAEEAAFKRHKTKRKADKIGASTTNLAQAKQEQEAKAARKALEALQPKPSMADRLRGMGGSVRDALPGGKKKDKGADDAKAPLDRIDQSQANKKADDELKKINTPLPIVGAAGTLDSRLAKGIGAGLDSANQGDDIASAAGTVAAATAGAAESALDVVRALKLYNATTGAEKSVHLREAAEALGSMVGNLVNIAKGSVNIAQHSNAVEAGAAVPILGIVAAVPSLISEINQLRSAITRLAKQQKVHSQLEKAVDAGDTSQATLFTIVSNFIARDAENIGKGVARVALDLTKIAGHGVTAGGITGPIGVALVGVGTAGKLLMSAADGVQGLVIAHQANDRRKKLQPTLHAKRDWDALAKDKPGAPENKALSAAIDEAAQVEKGTPAHAAALDKLVAAAEAFKKSNGGSPKSLAHANGLIEQARAEKKSWERDDSADDADPLAQKKGGVMSAQDAQQRDARKLMARDPRVAAQTLLEQAIREGAPGGPAFKVLESFGIKAKQVYGAETGDDRIASNREMRQKVLYKMGADDETALTLTQSVNETKDSVKGYLSMGSKHAELSDYMKAKNLLQHGGEAKRGPGWRLKMDLLTDDVEEKKETLLEHMELLVRNNDIDPALAAQVKELLRPRDEKKAA